MQLRRDFSVRSRLRASSAIIDVGGGVDAMGHLPIVPDSSPSPNRTGMVAAPLEEQGEEFLEGIKSYLSDRSRGVDPPASMGALWNQFYNYYAPRIAKYLKGWSLTDADRNDCFQDVWKEIVGSLQNFQYDPDRGRLCTWMMTVARNKAVDSIRRRNRQASENLSEVEANSVLDPRPDPSYEFERRSIQAQVRLALAELSGQVSAMSYNVIYLRWIEGRTTAEIAAALKLTPDQVRFRTHRMKRKFRDLFEKSIERDFSENRSRLGKNVARID